MYDCIEAANEPLVRMRPQYNVAAKVRELKEKGYLRDDNIQAYVDLPEVQSKL